MALSRGVGRASALLLTLAMLVQPAHTKESTVTNADGQRLFAAGRFDDARSVWLSLAQQRDAAAQFNLGLLYDLGRGVRPDPGTAYRWYRRAADAGMASAEFNVAVMLDSGRGAPRDSVQAAEWYARAASRGHARAAYNLALMYRDGDGLPVNLDVADAWLRAAAPNIQSAADRLAEPSSARPVPRVAGVATLLPATPLVPAEGSVAAAGSSPAAIELVWTAPAQPVPARFFVQVVSLDRPGTPEVFSALTDRSALLAQFPNVQGAYAWRVYTVGIGSGHYVAADWRRFTIAPER